MIDVYAELVEELGIDPDVVIKEIVEAIQERRVPLFADQEIENYFLELHGLMREGQTVEMGVVPPIIGTARRTGRHQA